MQHGTKSKGGPAKCLWLARCRIQFQRPAKFAFVLLPPASIRVIPRSAATPLASGWRILAWFRTATVLATWISLGLAFPLNGWAVLYGVTEPSRIVRLVRPRSLRWCPWITLLVSWKECRWSKAPVLAYPASRLIAPFMSQVL